jgi:hypothetical protein
MLVLLFLGGIVGSCSQYDLEDVGQAEDPAGKPTAQQGWSGAAVRSGSSDFRKIVALVPVCAAQWGYRCVHVAVACRKSYKRCFFVLHSISKSF